MPRNVKDKLDIRPVRWIDEVLQVALLHQPEPHKPGDIKEPEAKTVKPKVGAKHKPLRSH